MKESDLNYCESEIDNHMHNWKPIGIIRIPNHGDYKVYQCWNCNKCRQEELKYVKKGEWYNK